MDANIEHRDNEDEFYELPISSGAQGDSEEPSDPSDNIFQLGSGIRQLKLLDDSNAEQLDRDSGTLDEYVDEAESDDFSFETDEDLSLREDLDLNHDNNDLTLNDRLKMFYYAGLEGGLQRQKHEECRDSDSEDSSWECEDNSGPAATTSAVNDTNLRMRCFVQAVLRDDFKAALNADPTKMKPVQNRMEYIDDAYDDDDLRSESNEQLEFGPEDLSFSETESSRPSSRSSVCSRMPVSSLLQLISSGGRDNNATSKTPDLPPADVPKNTAEELCSAANQLSVASSISIAVAKQGIETDKKLPVNAEKYFRRFLQNCQFFVKPLSKLFVSVRASSEQLAVLKLLLVCLTHSDCATLIIQSGTIKAIYELLCRYVSLARHYMAGNVRREQQELIFCCFRFLRELVRSYEGQQAVFHTMNGAFIPLLIPFVAPPENGCLLSEDTRQLMQNMLQNIDLEGSFEILDQKSTRYCLGQCFKLTADVCYPIVVYCGDMKLLKDSQWTSLKDQLLCERNLWPDLSDVSSYSSVQHVSSKYRVAFCDVVHVVHAALYWVSSSDRTQAVLDKVQQFLAEHLDPFDRLSSQPNVGEIVLVYSQTNNKKGPTMGSSLAMGLFRALVTAILDSARVIVFAIDYGFSEVISWRSDAFKMIHSFLNIPAALFLVQLKDCVPVPHVPALEWCLQFFVNLTHGNPTICESFCVNNGVYSLMRLLACKPTVNIQLLILHILRNLSRVSGRTRHYLYIVHVEDIISSVFKSEVILPEHRLLLNEIREQLAKPVDVAPPVMSSGTCSDPIKSKRKPIEKAFTKSMEEYEMLSASANMLYSDHRKMDHVDDLRSVEAVRLIKLIALPCTLRRHYMLGQLIEKIPVQQNGVDTIQEFWDIGNPRATSKSTLQKVVCSALNGRKMLVVYFGVKRNSRVEGKLFNTELREEFKLGIETTMQDLMPPLRPGMWTLSFVPVFEPRRRIKIPRLYVAEFAIKQGTIEFFQQNNGTVHFHGSGGREKQTVNEMRKKFAAEYEKQLLSISKRLSKDRDFINNLDIIHN